MATTTLDPKKWLSLLSMFVPYVFPLGNPSNLTFHSHTLIVSRVLDIITSSLFECTVGLKPKIYGKGFSSLVPKDFFWPTKIPTLVRFRFYTDLKHNTDTWSFINLREGFTSVYSFPMSPVVWSYLSPLLSTIVLLNFP